MHRSVKPKLAGSNPAPCTMTESMDIPINIKSVEAAKAASLWCKNLFPEWCKHPFQGELQKIVQRWSLVVMDEKFIH